MILLSQFQLNLAMTIAIIAFHTIGLLFIRRRLQRSDRWRSPRHFILGFVCIALLDLPVVYIQLVYKEWHSLAADIATSYLALPWVIAHFNAAIAIVGLMVAESFKYMRRRFSRPSRTDTAQSPAALTKDTQTSVDAPLLAPASRRAFIKTSAVAAGGVALNSTFVAGLDFDGDAVIERVKLEIPNLPVQFRGMTIGMICDIHSSTFMPKERMEAYARSLQALNADLIVVPGDFVNSKLREVYPMAEAFSGLTAPMGVYGVTGNHDYYTREIEKVVKVVEEAGISVIRNDHVLLEKDGAELALLGVDDTDLNDIDTYLKVGKTERGTIEGLDRGMKEGRASILLAHKPYAFEQYAEFGVDLILSGHTHGGQIVLSSSGRPAVSVAALASTYIAGLYKSRETPGSQMYISRGVGTVGIPIRLNCPPEITHFMLV